MNKPQIFNNPMFGELPVIIVDGVEWFGATEAARSLSFSNPYKAVDNHVDEEDCMVHTVLTEGGPQSKKFINESGLYNLIFGAAKQGNNPDIKEKAKAFKRWVTNEVLTSIRKTGSYSVQNQFALPQTMPEALRLLAAEMEDKQRISLENDRLALQSAEQEAKLKAQEAPVAIYNLAISAHNTMSMQEVAKSFGTGRTRLYEILREEGIVMKGSTMPYQRFLDAGLFKVTERPRASGDTIVNDPATRVTAKGFDYIGRMLQKRNERTVTSVKEA